MSQRDDRVLPHPSQYSLIHTAGKRTNLLGVCRRSKLIPVLDGGILNALPSCASIRVEIKQTVDAEQFQLNHKLRSS